MAVGLLAGAAIAGGSVIANGFMQQRAAAYNQRMTEKNTAANYFYSQNAQRNAAANEVEGLRNAGLSPVLADGASAATSSPGSSGTAQAPEVNLSNALLLSQLRLNKAQADKVKADADSVKIDNAIKEGKNKTSGQNMAVYFDKLAADTSDPELSKFFKRQAEYAASGEYNVGNYQAYLDYLDVQGKSEEAIARKADKKLSAWISELRWNAAKGKTPETDPFVKALVSLDARQSDLVAEQAANLIAARKQVDKDTELIGAKISLTNAQIDQVKAAAAALENTNVLELIEKGEYGKALVAMLLQVFNGVASKGTSYVQ